MIVFTAAIMDFCHRGHLNILDTMHQRGYSIVVLHSDEAAYRIKKKIPVQPLEQRIRNIQLTGLTDEVLTTDCVDPAEAFLRIFDRFPPENCLFLRGDDNPNPPGKWLLNLFGVRQEYVAYTEGVSSTLLREELNG